REHLSVAPCRMATTRAAVPLRAVQWKGRACRVGHGREVPALWRSRRHSELTSRPRTSQPASLQASVWKLSLPTTTRGRIGFGRGEIALPDRPHFVDAASCRLGVRARLPGSAADGRTRGQARAWVDGGAVAPPPTRSLDSEAAGRRFYVVGKPAPWPVH